jgi:hypothetical protein
MSESYHRSRNSTGAPETLDAGSKKQDVRPGIHHSVSRTFVLAIDSKTDRNGE